MSTKKDKHRLTIGIIIDWLSHKYQIDIFRGISETAANKDINIICLPGGAIDSTQQIESKLNCLYDSITDEIFDGIIISSGTVGKYVDSNRLKNFIYKFKPLPIVSIAASVDGIPSVLVDNENGMYELTKHLVEIHNYNKFIFLKGNDNNDDAKGRLAGFLKALKNYKIEENDYFLLNGDFTYESGVNSVKKILNKKEKFDAIICANDEMALGVYEGLKREGINYYEYIPIVGFDDVDYINIKAPPITTVKQPVFEQGRQAMIMLLDLINGKSVTENLILPTELIVRESCGCFSDHIKNTLIPVKSYPDDKQVKNFDIKLVLSELNNIFKEKYDIDEEVYNNISERILYSIDDEINKSENETVFLYELNSILSDYILDINLMNLNNILSEIRKLILMKINNNKIINLVENLIHQARILISEKIKLLEKSKNYLIYQASESVISIGNEVILAFDQKENSLEKQLRKVGIESCYISMVYNDKLKFMLGFDSNGKITLDEKDKVFPINNLIPKKLFPQNHNFSMIYLPLSSAFNHLGFVMLEVDPFNEIYFNMPCQTISSALHKGLLYIKLKNQTGSLQVQKEEMGRSIERLRMILSGFIYAMTQTIELRDPYTAGHQRRVSELARSIAQKLNLSDDKIESIRVAGIVHDLGKISVPSEILNKPGKLKESEFNLIKDHPQLGYEILKSIDFPWPIAEMILQHHERLNGSGYPLGLKGEAIMLEARILCVADVVEAIASHRPYRPALGIEVALKEISDNSGIFYDPMVVDACLELFKQGYSLDHRDKKAI